MRCVHYGAVIESLFFSLDFASDCRSDFANRVSGHLKDTSVVCIENEHQLMQVERILKWIAFDQPLSFFCLSKGEEQLGGIKFKAKKQPTSSHPIPSTRSKINQLKERFDCLYSKLNTEEKDVINGITKTAVPFHLKGFIKNKLPETTGVYYFLDYNKKPIYIGKAINLRSRVKNHFGSSRDLVKKIMLLTKVKHIQFTETGTILIAGILEDSEIREYWPLMNSAQKNIPPKFAIVAYNDQKDFGKLAITKPCRQIKGLAHFHFYHKATSFLSELIKSYNLNAGFCGKPVNEPQVSMEIHQDGMKKLVYDYLNKRQIRIFLQKGRKEDESGYLLFENAMFRGFGFIENEFLNSANCDAFLNNLTGCKTSSTIENLIEKATASIYADFQFNVEKGAIPSGTAPRFKHTLTFCFPQSAGHLPGFR
ncbi:MAG TPA: nucleotide excision repair endonuclease [Bacteroidia bacterium]|nr:nucleotide excision repair endonuclease [Bacteroidia bacterium]